MSNQYAGQKTLGTVEFLWVYGQSDPTLNRVTVRWQGALLVEERLPLPPEYNPLPFSASDPVEQRDAIRGSLQFFEEPAELRVNFLEITDDGGKERFDDVVLFGPDIPDPPNPPDPPVPQEDRPRPSEGRSLVTPLPATDLLPYLFLSQWPEPDKDTLANRFIEFPDASRGSESLYQQLQGQTREQMHQLAQNWIDSDAFVRSIEALPWPLNDFARLDRLFIEHPPESVEGFRQSVLDELAPVDVLSWAKLIELITNTLYQEWTDLLWQSMLALVIQSGVRPQLLDGIIRTLRFDALLLAMGDSDDDQEPPQSGLVPLQQPWTVTRINAGLDGTLILPETLFPMPDADNTDPEQNTDPIFRITPYAIGQVQLIRQDLLAYEAGDISAIQNVLQGERKRSAERRVHETIEDEVSEQSASEKIDEDSEGAEQDLMAEVIRQLDYFKRDTYLYAQDNGSVNVTVDKTREPLDSTSPLSAADPSQTEPGKQHKSRINWARQLTRTAASSIARMTHLRRSRRQTERREFSSEQVIDRRSSTANLRGIYRWLNKRYRCWVEEQGSRLVFEVILESPAAAWIAAAYSFAGDDLILPKSLLQYGVSTFDDLTTVPGASTWYAQIAADYQALKIETPPAERLTISRTLLLDSEIRSTSIPIPQGYRAESAEVSVLPASLASGVSIEASLGTTPFSAGATASVMPSSAGRIETTPLALHDECDTLPVTAWVEQTDPENPASGMSLSVDVVCRLSDESLNEWKLATWRVLSQAYRERLSVYEAQSAGHLSRNGAGNRTLQIRQIRNSLKQGLSNQFIKIYLQHNGQDAGALLNLAPVQQFLEQAVAWDEMAYWFFNETSNAQAQPFLQGFTGDQEPFAAFLQSRFGRVLISATPGYEYRLSWFLATGRLWQGEESLTPAVKDGSPTAWETIDVFNALKTAALEPAPNPPPEEPWEIMVPTDMVILQDDEQLPVFGDRDVS